MPNDVQGAISNAAKPQALYAKLEDRILARDQQGASEAYYDLVPEDCAALPLAQTIWYIPTGLDIWNQKILKAPGHYARAPGWSMPPGPPPMPEIIWPDQEPEPLDGLLQERLDHWMTLVHRGNVLEAYRVFLGLLDRKSTRLNSSHANTSYAVFC